MTDKEGCINDTTAQETAQDMAQDMALEVCLYFSQGANPEGTQSGQNQAGSREGSTHLQNDKNTREGIGGLVLIPRGETKSSLFFILYYISFHYVL